MIVNQNRFQSILCLKLDHINNQIQRIFAPIAKRHGLSNNAAFTLLMIDQFEECSIGELQKKMGLNQGNTSSLCKKLEQMGLIARERKKEDERIVLLRLKEPGMDVLRKIDQDLQIFNTILNDKIAETEKDRVLQGMDSLSGILDIIEKGGEHSA